METVGIITTTAVGLAVLGAVVVTVMSIPDISRYLKIRKM